MRISQDSEAVATHAPPMGRLALHYRLAPHAEKAIYEAVSLIRADLPNAPIEVLPGKCVCEIKHSGFNKAFGSALPRAGAASLRSWTDRDHQFVPAESRGYAAGLVVNPIAAAANSR
jgi:hypothetical protein